MHNYECRAIVPLLEQAKCNFPAPAFSAHPLPTEHRHNMPALRNKKIAARYAALAPGGPITQRFLAPHPV